MKGDLLICGDATEEMSRLPEASVDLIIADPPYNLVDRLSDCFGFRRGVSYLPILQRSRTHAAETCGYAE